MLEDENQHPDEDHRGKSDELLNTQAEEHVDASLNVLVMRPVRHNSVHDLPQRFTG